VTYEDLLEKQKLQQEKIDEFSTLLDGLATTTDKKKMLWKEIYENALNDRLNASVLFTEAYTAMQTGVAEHISIGPVLTKYLERMNKSNEQLLRLSDVISKAEEHLTKINPEDIFAQIKE
jgi:malonyl CoA-acyl carrier protein transacylase